MASMESEIKLTIPEKIIFVTNLIRENPEAEIREQLIALINELINKDFSSLLRLLYHIDADEKKIRLYLNENISEDAASILADLIIERQLQKIESRRYFSKNNNDESDEEKW